MQVQVKIIDERLKLMPPTYQTPGSAGLDLCACLKEPLAIPPGETVKIGAGIAVFLEDPNFASIIIPRSGSGSRGLVLGNLVGLIDSDYQGELIMTAWNRTKQDMVILPMDRIAQLVIVPVVRPQFSFVDVFSSKTERGENGFGSTGGRCVSHT